MVRTATRDACAVDDPIIYREEVVALLFAVNDISKSLVVIEQLLKEDDGGEPEEEEDDA